MAQGAVSVFVFEDQMTLRVGITHVLKEAGLAVKGVDGLPEVGSVTDQQVDSNACIVGLGTNHSATLDAISAILAKREDAAIVVSGSNDPITIISRVYEAGARGYANAAESHTDLVDAVRSVVSSPDGTSQQDSPRSSPSSTPVVRGSSIRGYCSATRI